MNGVFVSRVHGVLTSRLTYDGIIRIGDDRLRVATSIASNGGQRVFTRLVYRLQLLKGRNGSSANGIRFTDLLRSGFFHVHVPVNNTSKNSGTLLANDSFGALSGDDVREVRW